MTFDKRILFAQPNFSGEITAELVHKEYMHGTMTLVCFFDTHLGEGFRLKVKRDKNNCYCPDKSNINMAAVPINTDWHCTFRYKGFINKKLHWLTAAQVKVKK